MILSRETCDSFLLGEDESLNAQFDSLFNLVDCPFLIFILSKTCSIKERAWRLAWPSNTSQVFYSFDLMHHFSDENSMKPRAT